MSVNQEFDALCEKFRASWSTEKPTPISEYLVGIPAVRQAELLRRLIPLDVQLRLARRLPAEPADYQSLGSQAGEIAREVIQAELAKLSGHDRDAVGLASPRDATDSASGGAADFGVSTQLQESQQVETDSISRPGEPDDGLTRIGRYEIRELLGQGTFGAVYSAFDTELLRPVAIKIPRRESLGGRGAIDEFLAEARMVARLDHPGIVPILDVGLLDNGRVYVVARLIEGDSLRARLDARNLPQDAAIAILAKVAEALHYAHKQGLVHRDVKPGNILVGRDLEPYLIDFGLAIPERLQQQAAGEICGSPAYMSPEQVAGQSDLLDGRSDIWSLGIIFYEVLTGRRPFSSTDRDHLFREIRFREPKPPRQINDVIPEIAEQVCLRALAKPIAARYTTALDFAVALRSCASPGRDFTGAVPNRPPPRRVSGRFAPPEQPPHYLPGQEQLDDIVAQITTRASAVPLGVEGRGGLGKTVLAAAVARDPRVVAHFTDGVFWVTVGQEPNTLSILEHLLREMGCDRPTGDDATEARNDLIGAVGDKACLFILDDIWDSHHAKLLLILTPRSSILATTRDAKLLTQLGFRRFSLHALSYQSAVTLLSEWAGESPEQLEHSGSVPEILDQTGRLPLALAVCGGMRRDGHTWQDIAEALRETDLEFLSTDAFYAHQSVMRSLAVGTDFLRLREPEIARAYFALAVFPADTWIPCHAVEVLWQSTHRATPRQCRKMLIDLQQKNLLNLDAATGFGRVMLHDLQHDYLQIVALRESRLAEYHQSLLIGYWQTAAGSWGNVADDGYFYSHVENHLITAERKTEAAALLRDSGWLERKLEVVGVYELVSAFRGWKDDADLELLSRAIRLSIHAVTRDSHQLQSQIVGRLRGSGGPLLDRFRNRKASRPWIECLTCGLDQPGALMQTLRGHTAGVLAVAITPDGQRLLSGSADKSVRLWDLKTGEELTRFDGHSASVGGLAITPDGKLAVSGSMDRTLRIWDLCSGRLVKLLQGHHEGTPRYARSMAAADAPLKPQHGHSAGIMRIAMSADGTRVISCGWGGEVCGWSIPDGRQIFSTSAMYGTANDVAISSRGDSAVVAFNDQRIGMLALSGNGAVEWRDFFSGHDSRVNCVAWLPDGNSFVSGSTDRTVRQWKAGTCVRELKGHNSAVSSICVTQDGATVCSGSADQTIRIWDTHSGELRAILSGHSAIISDLAFSADGTILVSCAHDNTVKVWDTSRILSTESGWTVADHDDRVVSVVVLPGGRRAASGAADGEVRIRDLETGDVVHSFPAHPQAITQMLPDAHGSGFLTASADHTVRMWDATGNNTQLLEGHTAPVWCVCLSPDGHLVCTAADDATLRVWRRTPGVIDDVCVTSPATRWVYGYNPGRRAGVCVTSDSRKLVFSYFDHSLQVWDIFSDERPVSILGHSDLICRIIPLPCNRVVSASYDGSLMLWRLDAEVIYEAHMRGHSGAVRTCEVTPDHRFVVSASSDRTIRIWDLSDGSLLRTLTGHSAAVNLLSICPRGDLLVSVADDSEIIVWSISRGQSLCRLQADTQLTSCHTTDTHIVAGDEIGRVHLLRLREV